LSTRSLHLVEWQHIPSAGFEDHVIETIRVDLHCHSSLSDGDHSPAYVAHSLAAIGTEWAALTDHNSLSGLHQFGAVLDRRGVHHIAGVEMDARSPIGVLHLLGYGFDPDSQPLLDALCAIRQPWRASARYWKGRFRSRHVGSPQSINAPAKPRSDTIPPTPPDTAEVICLLHKAGGLVFLAHPLAGIGTIEKLDAVLEWLQPEGLDGLEAFHKLYSDETRTALLRLAERRGLLTVAGSDFHGLHHSDGASPGVDMPLIHWREFVAALQYGHQGPQVSPYLDRLTK
jgi:predicted metal-dependent phosphoesterase TrpH